MQRMDMRRSKPRFQASPECAMECRIRRFRSVEWGVRESASHKRVARETKREENKKRTHGNRRSRVGLLPLIRRLELKLGHDDREDSLHLNDRHRAPDAVVRAVDERLERMCRVHRRRHLVRRPAFRPERLGVRAPEPGVGVDDTDGDV